MYLLQPIPLFIKAFTRGWGFYYGYAALKRSFHTFYYKEPTAAPGLPFARHYLQMYDCLKR